MMSLSLVSFALVVVVVQAMDGFDPNGQPPVCPLYKCTKGMTAVPKSRVKFTSTGCGTMGGGGMMVMSGGLSAGGEVYSDCCHAWHACYQTCGMPKQVCDTTFHKCAEQACGATDEKCTQDVKMKQLLMNLGGCQQYNTQQHQACECIADDKASQRRKDALTYFYKKHAPDQVDKVDALAAKVQDAPQKWAGLLQKLLAKYPSAIAIEKNEQEAMFEQMTKQYQDNKDESAAADGETESVEDDSDEVQEL